MEKATLKVSFPQDRLEALEFYMSEWGLTVEQELQTQMRGIYERNVPAATRRYLERNDPPEERSGEVPEEPARGRAMTDAERKEFNAKRREQRRAEKALKDAPAPLPAVLDQDAPAQEMVM